MSEFDFDAMIAEVEEYLADAAIEPEVGPGKYSIVHDSYDEMTWASALHRSESMLRMTKGMVEDYPLTGPALEDFYNLFFQTDPRMVPAEQMLKEYVFGHVLVSVLFDSDEATDLRKFTQLNEYSSGDALEQMEEAIREVLRDMQDLADAMSLAQAALQQALQDLAEALQEAKDAQDEDEGDPEGPGCHPMFEKLGEAKEKAEQAQNEVDALEQLQKDAEDDIADTIRGAAQDAADQLEQDDANARSYGLEDGTAQRMDYAERKALMKRLRSAKVQAVAKLVGSFKAVGKAARRRRVKHVPAEVYDYELGDDLNMLVPQELEKLAIPELAEMFWLAWAQHSLLIKKVRGAENAGQGPILVVCDESWSMAENIDDEHTKEIWSKAFALALCEQARVEHRDFTYVGFCNRVVAEFHFPGGRAPVSEVIDFVESFAAGGTDFVPALDRAMELIEECTGSNRDRPDVVFLTDGDGKLTEEFLARWHESLRRTDAHCYAIQFGGKGPRQTLTQVAGTVMQINQFNANAEGVSELFATI